MTTAPMSGPVEPDRNETFYVAVFGKPGRDWLANGLSTSQTGWKSKIGLPDGFVRPDAWFQDHVTRCAAFEDRRIRTVAPHGLQCKLTSFAVSVRGMNIR